MNIPARKISNNPPAYQPDKQPRRPHHIQAWAEKSGYSDQSRLAAAAGVDKSLVSRWYDGTSPGRKSQQKLAELFDCTPEELFCSPDEIWFGRILKQVPAEKWDDFRSSVENLVKLIRR